jgi:L-amino acid N-acyltransferase YncA
MYRIGAAERRASDQSVASNAVRTGRDPLSAGARRGSFGYTVSAPMQTSDPVTICDALVEDLPGLLAIYNDVIATSTAVYSDRPVTLEDRTDWWRNRTAAGYPVLVARDALGVAGFSTFGDFRTWPGYRYTVEHTVHVRADCRGRGVGRALLEALFPRAAALGKHVMIAGIDAANADSIRFHARLGFVQCAHLREVGFKFERWLDLVLMQRWIER